MGIGFIILPFLCLFILTITILLFIKLKKRGLTKLAYIIVFLLILIVVVPIFSLVFESELYFKSNAKEDLEKIKIKLDDDFEIESNEITGMNNYYQTTKIIISDRDKKRIINQIQSSSNYMKTDFVQDFANEIEDSEPKSLDWNYSYNKDYFKEIYLKEINYSAVKVKLRINSNSNVMDLNVIME